jgi:hypothetical protein
MNEEASILCGIVTWVAVFANILLFANHMSMTTSNEIILANILIFVPVSVAVLVFKVVYSGKNSEPEDEE